MECFKAEYHVIHGDLGFLFFGMDLNNLWMDRMGKRDFGKNHCRCLKYNELRTHVHKESIKEGTFFFQFCKRLQDALMNS